MLINLVVAALAGVAVPLLLKRMDIDPALAGGVVVTTVSAIVLAAMSGIIGGEVVLLGLLALPGVVYLHVHNARRGCYACRVDPA